MYRIFTGIGILFLICVLGFAGLFLFFQEKNEKNFFEIRDEVVGIVFHIPRTFERIPPPALRMKNSNGIYGFQSKDSHLIECVVANTNRTRSQPVSFEELENGAINTIRKNFSDTKLQSSSIVIKKDIKKGVRISVEFSREQKLFIQDEVIGVNDHSAFFFYCIFPKAEKELYEESVNIFLESIIIL